MAALRTAAAPVSSPNPRLSISTRSRLASFRRTRLGFAPGIRARPVGRDCSGDGAWRSGGKAWRRHQASCTAEGIEWGLLFGDRGGCVDVVAAEDVIGVVPERFKVAALMACAMCLCNADRVVMSVAKI